MILLIIMQVKQKQRRLREERQSALLLRDSRPRGRRESASRARARTPVRPHTRKFRNTVTALVAASRVQGTADDVTPLKEKWQTLVVLAFTTDAFSRSLCEVMYSVVVLDHPCAFSFEITV